MNLAVIIVLITVATWGACTGVRNLEIPAFFKMGTATSSYQIEGGWNASGKGENIWDYFTHTHPNKIVDHSNGDVAADSYHLWREDVRLLKYLGVDYYRFSLSWSRILPTGFTNEINPDGVSYYNNLINELLKNNIEPVVTIFHWDLPKTLQDLGGMATVRIAEYFEDYARVAFELFGDRVKNWITFNEPLTLCDYGYFTGTMAPGLDSPGIGGYLCSRTLLLGHARAYRLYQRRYKKDQGGIVGITINIVWYEAKTNSTRDIEAKYRALDFTFGWFMNPIFSENGNYPEVMIKRIEHISRAQNFSESRLPSLSKAEVNFIKGTYDFLGLNYYSANLVKDNPTPPSNPPSFTQDQGVVVEKFANAETTAADWLQVTPWGIRESLLYIKKKYNNPTVVITENGFPDKGQLNDERRINYIQQHLKEVLRAINEGCDVRGYTYWSFIDDFEWYSGYTLKFGLVQVDFNSPNRTRKLKSSAEYYKNILKSRKLPISP